MTRHRTTFRCSMVTPIEQRLRDDVASLEPAGDSRPSSRRQYELGWIERRNVSDSRLASESVISESAVRERKVSTGLATLYCEAARLDRIGMGLLRLGLVIVLLWIGALKFVPYEADSIVPLVANSPIMSFVYRHRAPEYQRYMNREGELNVAHRQWHESNGTYTFARALGVVIVFDTAHGFPYLSDTSRLVIKDAIMLGAAVTTLADSAKAYLRSLQDG
jgi:uncharacterized membrane protein YkgB